MPGADATALRNALIDAAPIICEDAAEDMEGDITAGAPIGLGDTAGDMAGSHELATVSTGAGAVSTLTYTDPVASYQDEGTGPHDIMGHPWLVFDVGGQTVFVKAPNVVHHPGSHVNDQWFSGKAEDDALWGQLCQRAVDAYSFG